MTGLFLFHVLTLPKYEQLVPSLVLKALEDRAPNFWRWTQAITAEQSVTAVRDKELVVKRTLERIDHMRKGAH